MKVILELHVHVLVLEPDILLCNMHCTNSMWKLHVLHVLTIHKWNPYYIWYLLTITVIHYMIR